VADGPTGMTQRSRLPQAEMAIHQETDGGDGHIGREHATTNFGDKSQVHVCVATPAYEERMSALVGRTFTTTLQAIGIVGLRCTRVRDTVLLSPIGTGEFRHDVRGRGCVGRVGRRLPWWHERGIMVACLELG
jgi:hypothetical protein